MLGRLLDLLGLGGGDDGGGDGESVDGAELALDWADADTEYGGDGPTRRYTCRECGATVEGVGPGEQVRCSDCETVFKGVLVPDAAVCPDCGGRIEEFEFYPEIAACDACGYRWESDPR
jgi:DNA-directed RNA polymerase subunit RPC12/RpoP